jgi:hypothetical protein
VNIATATNAGNPGSGATTFKIGDNLNFAGTATEKGNLTMHKDIKREWREDRDYLYPIPTKDRILTNGALTQNPGWDDKLGL